MRPVESSEAPDHRKRPQLREHPRPRRSVSRNTITLLKPLFRHSLSRDAYVLRLVGDAYGPVLICRPDAAQASSLTSPPGR
jgi:hypothetical protein